MNAAAPLLAAALLTATAALAGAHDAPRLFVGEDFEGRPVAVALDDPAADHNGWCLAPSPCVREHVNAPRGLIMHGFVLGGPGTYWSVLEGEGAPPTLRVYRCVFAGGWECGGEGDFPAHGAAFRNACAFTTAHGACTVRHS